MRAIYSLLVIRNFEAHFISQIKDESMGVREVGPKKGCLRHLPFLGGKATDTDTIFQLQK